ncbi:MAG: glycosyltransferase [Muribaculum sp.]|nr:glycosyltransferase [Muribaculum sp.]
MTDVSVVIVCMNNWDNISRCLNSIRKYTSVSYEVFVVTYLFTQDNLDRLRKEYPWIKVVESNKIRGFSENNNLALRQATGRYCFVLNDDTELTMPTIDRLVNTMDSQPDDVAIVSPVLMNPDGTVQMSGRPPMNWRTFILHRLHLWKESAQTDYVNKTGIFTTYNIVGAAFLIRTDVFRKLGWFDERYFFTPEDIALSTEVNKARMRCLVDTSATLIHFGGMSGKSSSMIQTATIPAGIKGTLMFFSQGNKIGYSALAVFASGISVLTIMYNMLRKSINSTTDVYTPMIIGHRNVIASLFNSKSAKEVFIKYYKKLQP